MDKSVVKVAVTGGAGNIAYSLLFRIANGDVFGKNQPISLQILEIPQALEALEGVRMELEDCAFPLLQEIQTGSDANKIFEGVHYAFLVGAKPRSKGMERKELLSDNGKIFTAQGKALNNAADPNVKVLVVGNPCNTNCLIAMSHAPDIPRKNFHAMTRLDQNRAQALLAQKASVDVPEVTNMTIWGNHSSTQVPDFVNAKINGKPARDVIQDQDWLEKEFISTVQNRGAAIIKARGASSAASAANAAIDAMRSIVTPTPEGGWFSSAVCTNGNPYGIEDNLVFSFPCSADGEGDYTIVPDVPWDDFLKEKMDQTINELIEEREMVKELIGSFRT